MTTAVQQLDALLERHRDGGRIEYSDLIALRAALDVPAPVQGPPDITHPAINDMCWKVIETLPDGMSAAYFNDLKPAIYDGLKVYHAELAKCQKAGLK